MNVKRIKDFPKKGVTFIDITPTFLEKGIFSKVVVDFGKYLDDHFSANELNNAVVVSPEARGFIIGSALATTYQYPFFMLRKDGKLPNDGCQATFNAEKEYGSSKFVVNISDMKTLKNNNITNIIIVDDILATGYTDLAIANFFQDNGFNVLCILNFLELEELNGSMCLESLGYKTHAFSSININ